MAFDIKIYGEIVPFQEKWITEQGGYVNLSLVQEQLKEANGQDVRVRIKSYGGDVEEGCSIYSELRRYAKDNNAKVITLAEGQCASIATVIFLAGDERIVTEFTQPFVHNAWCYVIDGDAKTLKRISADLEKVNEMLANHYSKHTDLTYEEARQLMDDETYISPEECLRIRFATSIEEVQRPAAMLQIINKSNNNVKMSKETKKVQTSNKSDKSFIEKLKNFFNKDVFTAENEILDFYELDDNETVKVGDKANLDGKPADGEITVANGDIYVFEAGTLSEIREVEPEAPKGAEEPSPEPEGTEMEKLQQRISELEKELEEKDNKIEELEDLLEKANSKMNHQQTVINNFKDVQSKFAPDQRKENKGRAGEESNKINISEEIEKFKQNRIEKFKQNRIKK